MRIFLRILLIMVFFFSSIGWFWQTKTANKNRKAIRLYDKGDIDEALSKWRDAQIDDPDKKELHYNIGGVLHEQEKYEESMNEYEKALHTKDTELQAKTYYNMGNTRYRMGKLLEAIEDYEKALEIDPDDEDAKYNIEFIRNKLKESAEKQQSEQEKQEEKDSQASQSQQERAQSGEQSEEEEEKGGKQEGSPEKASEKKEDTGKQEEGEMSEEDAVRLLDALKDDEKELQKDMRMHPVEGRYRVEKDW